MPYNYVWTPLSDFRDLLAASTNFQTLVDAADPTVAKAKAKIFIPGIPNSEGAGIAARRPFAFCDHGPDLERFLIDSDNHSNSGSIDWWLEADVPAAYQNETAEKWEDAHQWFCELLGMIVEDILDTSMGGGYIYMTGYQKIFGPARPRLVDQDVEDDFYLAQGRVFWGMPVGGGR